MIIANVIGPIVFVIALGFLLRKLGRLDEHVFSRSQIYIFSPALIFMTTAGSNEAMSLILKLLLYVVIYSVTILAVVQAAGRLAGSDRVERNATSLVASFNNSGFYGIPFCLLAFGEQGMVYATLFVVCSSIVQSTLGIFIANAGRKRPLDALLTVFKVPLIYATVLGKLLSHFDHLPPEPFMKMIELLGRSAIPLGLLLLGMQLAKIVTKEKAEGFDIPDAGRELTVGIASGVTKLVGGFAVALLLTRLFHFDSLFGKVVIVESSMPTAVNIVVYATEFDCRPKLVTIGVLTSTLGSIVTLSLILRYLG